MADMTFRAVHQGPPKKDSAAIMNGAPVYTEDLVPSGALQIRLLRSPHAMAHVDEIDVSAALRLSGVAAVFTHRDMPAHRFSFAGATYPDNNPTDRRILDEWVRFVGDPVAIVAAETEEAAEEALHRIRVRYTRMDPVLDFESADTAATKVHPEDNFVFPCEIGGDLAHNILSDSVEEGPEDFDAVYAACPVRLDETYHTIPNQQSMMETFRSFAYFDEFGRLTIVSSTQISFHARRLIAQALGIPEAGVRVIKPRIGGGFGAKQTLGTEIYAAVVTYLLHRPSYLIFTRHETASATNTRHAFRIRVRLGADTDGTVKALCIDSLANAGAYSEHSVNVVGLSGHKTIPLYAKAKAWRFTARTVFTNSEPAGAFRGFGATQGCFALESTVNKLAAQLKLDPTELRLKNLPKVGENMSAYYNEPLTSCSLDRCILSGREKIGWEAKYSPVPFSHPAGPGRYRGVGMAVTMQGSGLTNLDQAGAALRLADGGFYVLSIGASDMGTGCDTILPQIAAEVLECDISRISVSTVDTASVPYDKGSYASSTTYVTGNAVLKAAGKLREKMFASAAAALGVPADMLHFDGNIFLADQRQLSLAELARFSVVGQGEELFASAAFSGKTSPPPFAAAFAEVEVDTATGEVTILDLVGEIDCGTVINTNLARVQAEGGFVQGVGMALYEQSGLTPRGNLMNNSFLQYKIPSRLDTPKVRIFFEESCEPSGPFGAKSIGEVVINTPAPAILAAVKNAVGAEIHTLPATAESIYFAVKDAK